MARTRTPEERLNDAILSFAQGVNNDFEEVIRALAKNGQADIADDLLKLHDEWRDAWQAAFDSFTSQAAFDPYREKSDA